MRIVAVLPLYPPQSRVGAFLATHELLTDLHRKGHTVTVLRRLKTDGDYTLDGVRVLPGRDYTDLNAGLRAADVVLSHLGDDGIAHHAAQRWGKPSVRLVHGHDPDALGKLEGASLVVFNSHHLAAEVGWTGRQIVVHPPTRNIPIRQPGNRVTLINLSQEKGGELLWRLAKKLPDVPFMGVKGGYGFQVTELPITPPANLMICGPTPHMHDVYARTRILLMPSERETWGMCALEAAQCGIPTIAHPCAGLLESMGDAATYADRDDEAAWLTAITTLLQPAAWQEASVRALARGAHHDPRDDLARFARAIEEVPGGIEDEEVASPVREAGEEGHRQGRENREEEVVTA